MKSGKTHKIVTAYSALATLALGLIAFDAFDRGQLSQGEEVASGTSNSDSGVSKMIGSASKHAGKYWASLAAK
jgi:hypothetical protein